MKPRIKLMADIVPSIDFDAMEFEKTPLLLAGEPVIFAGDHGEFVWLKWGNKNHCFKKADVIGHLKLAPNANRMISQEK